MEFADENLRKSRARAGAIPHLLAERRVNGDVEFRERGLFARQQRFGGAAIAAARTGVDFDGSGRVALGDDTDFTIIWEFCGYPQPARTPARRRMRLWRAAAPARTRQRWRPRPGPRPSGPPPLPACRRPPPR